ncbi:MAG: hypothetical protein HY854_06095 [Burkholderiales bacterium]|nr:hypothetical protein [Burkholderiales bacterium]
MLTFTQAQFDAMQRDTFFRLLQERISAMEGQAVVLEPDTREELWNIAQGLQQYGITTIRGCLVMCHVVWEMGPESLTKIAAFNEILTDPTSSEADKVDAIWLLRTQLLAALEED